MSWLCCRGHSSLHRGAARGTNELLEKSKFEIRNSKLIRASSPRLLRGKRISWRRSRFGIWSLFGNLLPYLLLTDRVGNGFGLIGGPGPEQWRQRSAPGSGFAAGAA